MQGKSIEELRVGESAEKDISIEETNIRRFAQITGNFNLIYFHDPTAKECKLGEKIVPQTMMDAFISALIGEKLPGPGSIIIKHEMEYLRPVCWGKDVRIFVNVKKIMHKSRRVVLFSCVYDITEDDDPAVCMGDWVVLPRS